MPQIVPTGIPAQGSVKIVWVPTLANPNAPTLAELNGTGTVDLSCYLTRDGWAPDSSQDVSTEGRLCQVEDTEVLGKVKNSLGDLKYVYDPQKKDAILKAAYDALAPGLSGYLVARYGIPSGTDLAADQIVDVFSVTLGVRNKMAPEENSSLKVVQKVSVTQAIADVAIVGA